MKRIIYILLAAASCSCIGRFKSPQVDVPQNYVYDSLRTTDTIGLDTHWWTLFGDTTLNRLIDVALENNHDIASAALKVEQARLSLGVTRSQFLPQFSVDVNAKGEYAEQTGIVQQYGILPTATWEISLFGALRHSTEAARAELLATEWARRGVMLLAGCAGCGNVFYASVV